MYLNRETERLFMNYVILTVWIMFFFGLYLIGKAFDNATKWRMEKSQGVSALGVLMIICSLPVVSSHFCAVVISKGLSIFL